MTNNNVLVLSAGRRVELVQLFQQAVKKRSLAVSVIAADMVPEYASACRVADQSFGLPHVHAPDYLRELEQLCVTENVALVVPTIDTELVVLAENRGCFADLGVEILISDIELVRSCRDKRLTGEMFERLGINYPRVYPRDNIQFPCFCKPYDGSSSLGAKAIEFVEDLTDDDLGNEKNMFMELVGPEYQEYTIDTYYDRSGDLKCVVPRERIEVRAGEVSKGATRRGAIYEFLLPRLARLEGARSCVTVQVFYDQARGSVKGLEVNPRFGGGFPLSHAAGADFPGWLLDEYLGGQSVPFYDDWEPDLLMLRYDAKVLRHATG